jgi:hypothetical protein
MKLGDSKFKCALIKSIVRLIIVFCNVLLYRSSNNLTQFATDKGLSQIIQEFHRSLSPEGLSDSSGRNHASPDGWQKGQKRDYLSLSFVINFLRQPVQGNRLANLVNVRPIGRTHSFWGKKVSPERGGRPGSGAQAVVDILTAIIVTSGYLQFATCDLTADLVHG